MNRSDRIARSQEIYLEEKAKYDVQYRIYKEEREKWLEENKAAGALPGASISWGTQPKPPSESKAEAEAIFRIMDELTISRDMANEYIAIIKHRVKQQ